MTRQGRRKLFYCLFAAFLVLGIGAILYTSGWRLDFANFQFKKVGAIYVRSFPEGAEIYLDGKAIKNDSGLLKSGTLINNLFPKTYELKLTLDGFKDWRENISVAPSLVSEAKYAVLIPKNAAVVSTTTIRSFSLVGDGPVIENSAGSLAFADKKLAGTKILGWTTDLQKILTVDIASNTYFLNDVATKTLANLNTILKKAGFDTKKKFEIAIDADDARRVVVIGPTSISFLDIGKSQITKVYLNSAGLENTIVSQYNLAWAEFNSKQNTSTIVIYDKFLQRTRARTPSIAGKNLRLEFANNDKLAILQNDGGFYIYDLANNKLSKIADDVKNFRFASGGGAVAALENKSLEVFYFNSDNDYYRFNLPEVNSAEDIIWYSDQNHIFVIYPAGVKFLDIKDGALRNFTAVAETNSAKYDEKNNRLYFVEGNKLFALDFPK